MITDDLQAVARRARVLDLAIYGAMSLAEHSIPGEGWSATLWALQDASSDLHRDLANLAERSEKQDAGAVAS